ncbi:16035_t:CDS:2 [Gigaspora rosea]|nr:16035_t:CDS:2 [Gigaspora rosea]
MPPEPVSKKTRCHISDKKKKEICEFVKKNLSYKHQEIADEFTKRYSKIKIDRTTISKILKKADEYQQISNDDVEAENIFRHRFVKFPMLELAMNMWIEQVITEKIILSDLLIKEKGHQFAQAFGIPNESLTFSNEWISRFKKRNGLKKAIMHGKAVSAPLVSLPAERIKLQELLSNYSPENIYNANETGLFYRLLPNQTLSKKKRFLERRRNNKKAWMTSDTWENWLKFIDNGFRIQGKKVLFLVNNAILHMTPGTNNTAEVQDNAEELSLENDFEELKSPKNPKKGLKKGPEEGPEDLKDPILPVQANQHISNLWMLALLKALNQSIKTYIVVICLIDLRKIKNREAIYFISDAWDEVNETTIKNCWRATKIIPEISESEENDAIMLFEDLSAETNPTAQEITDNIKEYIQMINQPAAKEDVLTDESIIEMAIKALEKVIRYQESLDIGNGFDKKEKSSKNGDMKKKNLKTNLN